MAIIGLSKPYYAIYSATGSAVSYASGGVLGKATEANIDIETSEDNNLYADNGIAETDRQFTGGTLTLSTDDLSQEVSKAILGLKEEALDTIEGITDEDVQELIYDDTQQTPYLGVGFIVKKVRGGVTMWRGVVLTKVMFSIPSDAATTQGESIEWQVPELSATVMRDDSATHMWKREATFTTEAQAEAIIKDRLNITAGGGGCGIEHRAAAASPEDTVKALDESMWLLSQMLEAGARYARMNGMDNPEPLDADGLYDCCDMSDFAGLRGKIMETISNGQKATVEAEPPKNAGAAQGER